DLVIATKVGLTLDEAKPNSTGLSRKHMIWQLKESLKRLQTDYVDLFYLHRFDPETRLEETLTTVDGLVREGMVRYVGCSNFSVEQLAEVDRVCESLGLEKPVAVQPEYNMIKRDIDADLLPYCRNERLAVLAYSPLAGGFLTGKYGGAGSAPPPGSRAAANKDYLVAIGARGDYATLERLSRAAAKAGVSPRQLALAWVVRDPVVTSAIVGASTPEQVVENARALELKIDAGAFHLA
ncbi:MAG: aldo/keto reductase, partial [Nitrososphaerales archaeon]